MSLAGRAFAQPVRLLSTKHVGRTLACRSVHTQPLYDGHVPLNWFEKTLMFAGSSYMSLTNPRRGGMSPTCLISHMSLSVFPTDMVAAVGDLSAGPVLPRLRDAMLASKEGRSILKERPRISTKTVDLNRLAALPEGTIGRAYVSWLERCGVTPDTREPVRLVFCYFVLSYTCSCPETGSLC